MKAASLKEIKSELESLSQNKLLSLCIKLVKFKKDNKELLSYLLFESDDENAYIENVKCEIDKAFIDLNIKNLYIAKKNLRKIIRVTNRYSKYSGLKSTEASLLMHVCRKIIQSGLKLNKSAALSNLYFAQIKKIMAAIETMHEDLQYDYRKELNLINHN